MNSLRGIAWRATGNVRALALSHGRAAAVVQRSISINHQAAVPPDLSRVRLPPRTIPEELLTFKARTYFASDTGNPYPNVHGVHLAEFKVVLSVRMEDLGLDRTQQEKLRKLAGLRFNKKEQILRLPCELFPSRVENKKYLVYLLETLLEEARKPDAPEPAAPPLTEHPHEQDTIHIKF